jgi:hypothetical protein
MRHWIVLAGILVGVLAPGKAPASLCLHNEFLEIYVIDLVGFGGPFFTLGGEWVIGGAPGGGGHPFIGTAHLRPDGKVHFSLIIGQAGSGLSGPLVLEGTLNPPSFTTGTATERSVVGTESTGTRTLGPAACPPLID